MEPPPPPSRASSTSRGGSNTSSPHPPGHPSTQSESPHPSPSSPVSTPQQTVPSQSPIPQPPQSLTIDEIRARDAGSLNSEDADFANLFPAQPSAMSRHPSSGRGDPSRDSRQPEYQLVSPATLDPRRMSQNNKDQLINSLRTHRVNTITELRRIEKIFAYLDSAEVTEPITSAWRHYVTSHNLLNELRGLTRSYPFSSACLDEAKQLVVRDPTSVRSWNYCWLVLIKIERDQLIGKHARQLAAQPAMWGGRKPTAADVERLANACIAEWTSAVRQMLRHWDRPPTTTGT